MRISQRLHPGAALALAVLLAGSLAARPDGSQSGGQQQPERSPQPIRTEANFVRVDAYPTSEGRPVQGLTAEEFEVLEDGVPQQIEAFEHVMIRPAAAQAYTRDPNTQEESLQAAANPRNRVFVLFLDVPHVTLSSAVQIREPLIRLLDRILGPDDLVGVMTPSMSASEVVLGRKTEAIQENLRSKWPWGERFEDRLDATELKYVSCYPRLTCDRNPSLYSDLAVRMIERKRELATLEALQDLARYLGAIREERKAILAVSEGWLLLPEAPDLMTLRECGRYKEETPGVPDIMVSPEGKLTTTDRRNPGDVSKYACDTDRMRLASTDHERFFRDVMDDANRANASFYPIDPRGLPAFDHPIGPQAPPPPTVDRAMLRTRLDSMRTLAENTDGMAVLDSNNLDAGLKRIADDLTSYYLLGYYSTNARLDGGFRRISVRVKRPGVQVRARRGYRAATAEEIAAARIAAEAPAPSAGGAIASALASLDRLERDVPLHLSATAAPTPGGLDVWVVGELPRGTGRDAWSGGGDAEIRVSGSDVTGSSRVALAAGDRAFVSKLTLKGTPDGPLDVRVRLAPASSEAVALNEGIRLDPGEGVRPLLYRAGRTTANRVVPAADPRFSRTDRLRLELRLREGYQAGPARVLDAAGTALSLPVKTSTNRDPATGEEWLLADLTLAPLAPADYVIELVTIKDTEQERVLTAVRVVR